jgi:hypothetical protein
MLNRDQLLELGRFKLMMRKVYAESVQVERFLEDSSYQTRLLDLAEEADDDELLMLSLTLRARLGRLGDGDAGFSSPKPHYPAPEIRPVDDVSSLTMPVSSRMLPSLAAVSLAPAHEVSHALQASVDAAPPRRRGLLGGLWGSGSGHATDAAPPRYIASLR